MPNSSDNITDIVNLFKVMIFLFIWLKSQIVIMIKIVKNVKSNKTLK